MAVIENRVTEEGDVLIIKTNTPIVGLIALTQFVDTTANESEDDYFRKEFRYSQDGGMNFGNWTVLTIENIGAVQVSKTDTFVIEYRYTRVGMTPAVELEFNDILVSGLVEDLPYPIFGKSFFSQFFNINDINVFGWALNVLEKLYAKGTILPDFYERSSEDYGLTDEDFIAYWNTITHFFALIVYYARQFEDFNTNEILLNEFLKSKDLITSESKDITELLYLYQNYIKEYQKRGTSSILDQTENGADVDGELIRLINHEVNEELIFATFQNFESGWCIGKCSPMWKGTEKITNIIKGYEFTEEVVDLAKYPLVSPLDISIVSDKMVIDNSIGAEAGIGYSGNNAYKLTVDPNIDYEISFLIKQTIAAANLNFGCDMWDESGSTVNSQKSTDGTNSSWFIQNLQLKKLNQFYYVRCILWNSARVLDPNDVLNTGSGNNLIMPVNANKIVPKVLAKVTGGVEIYGFKVRPRKLNFSRGHLGKRKLVYLLSVNNNKNYSDKEVDLIIQQKLIPYNYFLKSNFIKPVEIPN